MARLKRDLSNAVQNAIGCTKKDAEAAVDAMIKEIEDALASGEEVSITGFGKFLVRTRRARTGVNPQKPSEKIQLPESVIPAFKAGKTLKDKVAKK
ncbi:MAG: HU family DNA-binding protein [Candidatus Dojkabacteria bacterium]